MEIVIAAVGKLRPSYREACDEYVRRLRRYVKVEEREVKEASRAPTVERGTAAEARLLLERVPAEAVLVALAREGRGWSSVELAQQVDSWRLAARPVIFAIGGSHGLGAAVLDRAAARWSLGPLTLPHELARVVVVEQLYRAFTILGGEPYHKGRES